MPYCSRCGKEVLAIDRYCPNCGQVTEGHTEVSAAPVAPTPSVVLSRSPESLRPTPEQPKSPAGAAALNFFFPGLGYIYLGLGHDSGEAIFGVLVFVFYFIGFEVGNLVDMITYVPSSSPVNISPFSYLVLLALLLPFAFAYDGYRRAKSP